MYLIDTDVAIHIRDRTPSVLAALDTFKAPHALSILTRIELENGVIHRPELAAARRAALDLMLPEFDTLSFGEPELVVYRRLVERAGFSRRKIIDRMVAATALVHGARLVTSNIEDFADIDGLSLVPIPAPDA